MEQELYKIYEKYNFPGVAKLYAIAKREGMNLTYKDIEKFVRQQIANQLYTKPVKPTGSILSYSPNERVQFDIVWMKRFSHANDGYKYILVFIDVFTRKISAYPLKNREIEPVYEIIEKYLKEHETPHVLTSDNESAFMSRKVKALLDKKDIFHDTVDVGYHAALGVIDNAVKRLKMAIYKYMKVNNNIRWIDRLKDYVDAINETPNSGIMDLTPNEINNQQAVEYIQFLNNYKLMKMQERRPTFKVGDKVRVEILNKAIKNRAYDQLFGNDIYTIKAVNFGFADLDNGKTYPFRRLKKVTDIMEQEKKQKQNKNAPPQKDAIDEAKRQQMSEDRRKREDRDVGNIIERRTRGKRVQAIF